MSKILQDYARGRSSDGRSALSRVLVEYKDGKTESFVIKATPAVLQSLVNNSVETGFLHFFNDKTSYCLNADEIKSISVTMD